MENTAMMDCTTTNGSAAIAGKRACESWRHNSGGSARLVRGGAQGVGAEEVHSPGGGGGGWHKASVSGCLSLAAPNSLSPLPMLTLCGSGGGQTRRMGPGWGMGTHEAQWGGGVAGGALADRGHT